MNVPVRAPEIDRPGLAWFNVTGPLSLAELRGRLVILDFWTFCCINCMHVLPALRQLERTFPEELVVIGVHSPKFTAEKDAENVARAIARYGIVHPVVHDPEFRIWRDYAVRAWPSLVFIDPSGREVGRHSGEADPERLLSAVSNALRQYREHGLLEPGVLPLKQFGVTTGRYAFPGKIKPMPASPDGRFWALADAGHHQIAILDDKGAETARYGATLPGLMDGPGGAARFNTPQGLVCGIDAEGRSAVFVADTGNHAVRKIDLGTGQVTTLAGTGRRGPALGGPVPAQGAELASPWDLERKGTQLFIANAGTHQLGVLDLRAGTLAALAGDGGEALLDGPAASARLAQPSGLALSPNGTALYFADSETSSIRMLRLQAARIETLVGTGLFDFGNESGPFELSRLQHPLGLCPWDDRLVVADSYNASLRVLDLETREVRDLDDGLLCEDPVCLPLAEPAGVWTDGPHRLLVSDTNNHRILEYRPAEARYRTWAK